MIQRVFGKTGRSVSEIGLGTWQLGTRWGDPFDHAEAMRILELLQEETTEENIVAQLMKEYEGKKEEIAPLVSEYIRQLFQEGLLEE